MQDSRRKFIKQSVILTAGIGTMGWSAKSYSNIIGANDRVRVGVVGFSDRFRDALLPSFLKYNQSLNFDIVAVSDLWNFRREQGAGHLLQW